MNSDEKLEIVFNFDTTGSMYPCIDQVRRNLEETVGSLFKEIPNLKIGIGANGDYCDKRYHGYTTKQQDLTTDLYTLTKFVRDVGRTGGGANGGEAYELALHESRTAYNWSVNSRKILVMIGDEIAHTPHFRDNTMNLDWRVEAAALAAMGVQIYTIQCLSRREAPPYYSELARIGNGYHLRLDQFNDINTLVDMIVYQQVSKDRISDYEQEVSDRGGMNRNIDQSFAVLTGRAPRDTYAHVTPTNTYAHTYPTTGRYAPTTSDLVPVDTGRFQALPVYSDAVIKDFVTDHHLEFNTGRGFYEFTKREEIQESKEIVLVERGTGDMFTGAKAREIIGIPFGQRGKISPGSTPYDVFIQSTSYNRKLKAGTRFLYEVDLAS